MSEDERGDEAPRANDGEGGAGRYSDPGDAGSPLSDDPGSAGKSDGTHSSGEPSADPNPTPRREEAGL
jgi:hypothetical protein